MDHYRYDVSCDKLLNFKTQISVRLESLMVDKKLKRKVSYCDKMPESRKRGVIF
jgi:hypothetical protein